MKTLLAFLLTVPLVAQAVLIPTDRLTGWVPGTNVGIVGGIPTNRTTLLDVTQSPYNAPNNGVGDATAGIQAAMTAATAGQVVYLPAGTYKLTSSVTFKNNVTLRGAGIASTTVTLNGSMFFGPTGGVGNTTAYDLQNSGSTITSGATQGSTVITLADTSPFTVGDLLAVGAQNPTAQPTLPTQPVILNTGSFTLGAAWTRIQMVRLISKTATTMTFDPPLIASWTDAPAFKVGNGQPKVGVGIEDMTVDGLNNLASTPTVAFWDTADCWLKNVKVTNGTNYTVWIDRSLRFECRRLELPTQAHAGNNGSGILIYQSTRCLFEDNIVYNNFPCVEVNNSTMGSAFLYNLFHQTGLSSSNGVTTNHGSHNDFNLYEGNVAINFQSDGLHGGESRATFFRNLIHTNWGGAFTYAVALKRFSRFMNIVGNVIGVSGMTFTYDGYTESMGQPNLGNGDYGTTPAAPPWTDWGTGGQGGYQQHDDGVAATAVTRMNYRYFDNQIPSSEALGGDTFPTSLAYAAKPAYFGALVWPPANPNSPGTPTLNQILQKIPAGYRYVNATDPPPDTGGPTLGSATIPAGGTTIVLAMSIATDFQSGDAANWTLSMSGGAVTMSSPTGSGTSTITCTLSRTVNVGETGTIAYSQPGNGVEDLSGNDMASVSGFSVTNSSTAGGGGGGPGAPGGRKLGPPRGLKAVGP